MSDESTTEMPLTTTAPPNDADKEKPKPKPKLAEKLIPLWIFLVCLILGIIVEVLNFFRYKQKEYAGYTIGLAVVVGAIFALLTWGMSP